LTIEEHNKFPVVYLSRFAVPYIHHPRIACTALAHTVGCPFPLIPPWVSLVSPLRRVHRLPSTTVAIVRRSEKLAGGDKKEARVRNG